jgi:hypothetical protein
MHFLQHFGQLFVLVQEHLIDLFLQQFLFNYRGFVSLWVADEVFIQDLDVGIVGKYGVGNGEVVRLVVS